MDYFDKILSQYKSNWQIDPEIYLWDRGPIEKLYTVFRVLEFQPNGQRQMWSYATCGMSDEFDENPVELHLFSEQRDSSLIELLTAIAYYHKNTSKLVLNSTVNFGRPWRPLSDCSYGFISLSFLDGPSLETFILPGSRVTKFYWVVPITKAEVEFKKKYGVEALEEKFEENDFNYLSNRRSLV